MESQRATLRCFTSFSMTILHNVRESHLRASASQCSRANPAAAHAAARIEQLIDLREKHIDLKWLGDHGGAAGCACPIKVAGENVRSEGNHWNIAGGGVGFEAAGGLPAIQLR